MTTNILTNINVVSPASSSGSWANITGMSVSSITVQGTNSVLLLMFNMQIDPAGDNTPEFRFYVNGSAVGSPNITAFSDAASGDDANSVTMVWAIDGLSGSANSFSVQWRTITGAPAADTTRNRTFQILEIVGGDAEIIVDQSAQNNTADPPSWADLFTASSIPVVGTGSILIMIANVPYTMTGDDESDFQFAVDASREGAITSVYTDASNEGNGWSGVHVLNGLSAGDHSFHLEWQAKSGTGSTDGSRLRTFQVVEITANATLKLELVSSDPGSAPGSYGDVNGLSDSYVVAATDAIALIFANIQIVSAADRCADFMIGVDSVEEGAEILSYTDSTVLSTRLLLARAKTGLSAASHTFAARWIARNATPTLDTNRARTLFVIEFVQVAPDTYKLEDVSYDKNGNILVNADCYLYKDNGDNTISFKQHVVSHATTAAYSFTGITDNDAAYIVVFIKDDTPHVFDVTDHVLQPVLEE